MTVAIVLVSHSAKLAEGTAELAKQMAPHVPIFTAGGNDDGQLGTSLTKVQDALGEALKSSDAVVALADLGSAGMTVQTALELEPDWAPKVHLPMAPFVEGAVAAAVSAEGNGSLDEVTGAAAASGTGYAPATREDAQPGSDTSSAAADGEVYVEHVMVPNALGIHARPAAALAKTIADSGVPVTVDGVDGASVLMLLSLSAEGGRDLEIKGTGLGARDAVRKVCELIKTGFGEVA